MKRLSFFSFISLVLFMLMGCNSNNLPLEMVAFNSLSQDEQNLIPTSPKDSVLEKVNVTAEIKALLNDDYNKTKVYSVTFNHTESESNGNLVVFVDTDKKTVVGKGFKE